MSIYDRQLILFSGKGGVGKTTAASGFALSCARRGERTLLMELNVRDKVSAYFGAQKVGTDIIEVEENLHAVNVTPDAALKEYGMMLLRVKLIYRAVFENTIVRNFLNAIPGLNDLLMIGKAYFHANEQRSNGEKVWDKVVVDAPATGHGIFLLQIPSVITSTLSSGHMYREAQNILDFLQDPRKTALNLVTLAEEMPVNETLMLREEAKAKLEIPIGCIVVNGLYPDLFDDSETEWLQEAHSADDHPDAGVREMLDAAIFRDKRVAMQQDYFQRLAGRVDDDIYRLPYYFTERITFPEIEAIAERFHTQISGDSP